MITYYNNNFNCFAVADRKGDAPRGTENDEVCACHYVTY